MAEYISRDDALLHSEIIRVYSKDYGNIDVVPVEYLADIPAADVQPVKRGKWIENAGYGGWSNSEFKCPECGIMEYKPTNFCPNCGAELRGIDNG